MNLVLRLSLLLVLLLSHNALVVLGKETKIKPSANRAIADEIAFGAKLASGFGDEPEPKREFDLLVSFCASWGMKGNFMQLKRFLENQYPELQGGKVRGQTHPPTAMGELIGAVTQIVWFGGIALLLGGSQIFSMLNIKEPEWYEWMKANTGTCFIGLFIMNNFGSTMMTTGAFEVYLNDELIYSKLQTGRMPTGGDITAALERFGLA